MEYIALITACVIISITSWLAVNFWQARQAYTHKSKDKKNTQVDLYIPVLGVSKSGKTSLLAALGEHLSEHAYEELTTRCLTRLEEEPLRGRTLKQFDPDQVDQDEPHRPGERTTEAMIYYERAAFKSGSDYHRTLEPEDAYFMLQYAAQGQLANPLRCALTDIPGEHLSDERGHLGNIKPRLERADGLILVIDGAVTNQHRLNHQRLPLIAHYRQVLEYFCARSTRGPIWIVITKVDLLSKEERDADLWRTYVLNHVAPQLKLAESGVTFNIALTSAKEDCILGWESIAEQGKTFLLHLKDVIKTRLGTEAAQSERYRVTSSYFYTGVVTSVLAFWLALGAFQFMKLPVLEGTVAWDWGSLKTASEPYLKARQRLDKTLSPLTLYQEPIDERLEELNEAYRELLEQKLVMWVKGLRDQSDLSATTKRLDSTRDHFLEFHQQVNQWLRRTHQESQLLKQIEEVSQTVKSWSSLLSTPVSFKVAIQDFQKIKEGGWTEQCTLSRGQDQVSCGLSKYYDNLRTQSLSHMLDLSISRSNKAISEEKSQVRERISPLLTWGYLAGDLKDGNPLKVRFNQKLRASWEAAWAHLEARIKNDWSGSKFGGERLKALQQFELDRRDLETRYSISLKPPKNIDRYWRERLNREAVSAKNNVSAREIIKWSEDYLDSNRLARVHLSQNEARWHKLFTQALADQQRQLFVAALAQSQRDITELSHLEGAGEIKESLERWRARFNQLQKWNESQEVKLKVDSLNCDASRFEMLKLTGVDEGAFYYPDRLSYYVVIHNADEATSKKGAVHLGVTEEGEELNFIWSPWSALRFTVYDEDGSRDLIDAEDDGDDDQVGQPSYWRAQRDPPHGTIQFGPEEVCILKVSADHPLPEWVYQLNWVVKETP